jgi:hypothetical protein
MVLCNGAVWQISTWLSALRQPAHQSAAPKCHAPSRWRASCPSAVGTTPSVRHSCSGHRQVSMRSRAVVHSSYSSIKVGGTSTVRISCAYPSLRRLRHNPIQSHKGGLAHATVKHHSPSRHGRLVLVGRSISPQPNFSVKPTTTSFTCGFPARFALRCGLPVALGYGCGQQLFESQKHHG